MLAQKTTFYERLQSCPELDMRDTRGKRHDLSVVLIGVCLGLLSNRDGNLSSLHRHMVNTYPKLRAHLGLSQPKAVSRSQLPLILRDVNLPVFEQLAFECYGIMLSEGERHWFSVDGKELRGSILKGDKRGEAVVEAVGQREGRAIGQVFYNGTKESEIPAVRDLLLKSGISNQNISMDALHLNPETLRAVEKARGGYLVGLKDNQPELLAEMNWLKKQSKPTFQAEQSEKGHGRVEKRACQSFDVRGAHFDKRWMGCGLQTLVWVQRSRWMCKTAEHSEETALFLSNIRPDNEAQAKDLFDAARGHWAVETTHHIRDVSLKEDALRTKKTKSQRPPRP